MAYRCEICKKGRQVGHNVSHSKRRTRRIFLPNLQWARVPVDKQTKRMRLCIQCLRSVKAKTKAQKEKPAKEIKIETKNLTRAPSAPTL